MEPGLKTKTLRIDGMTCAGCQNKIERKLRSTAGVASADADYGAGTAVVVYDADIITIREIEALIERLDYRVLEDRQPPPSGRRAAGILIVIVSAYLLISRLGLATAFNIFPAAEAGMGYGMLFVIGLLTSVHCVAMCGGLNLSQCIPQGANAVRGSAALRPSLLYNLGRVLSYTAVGAVVGALGSVLSPAESFRGAIQLLAGVFMIVMGVNMSGAFPRLRRLAPRMPRGLARRIDERKGASKSPMIVGLLNGLMPCGPLQAMQLYALSAGSAAAGALSMLLFSLGTVPLMFGLGALSSVLSKKFTRKVMTVGAALVVFLGLSMLSQGFVLSGLSLDFLSGTAASNAAEAPAASVEDGYQIVTGTLRSGRYPAITVRAGIPVKWTIDAPEGSINGCNNRMLIPEFGIEHKFTTGANLIEFTPTETGRFPYSCWMGMIRGTITVVDADATPDETGAYEDGAESELPYGEDAYAESADPIPANAEIPTEALAIAKFETVVIDGEAHDIQRVSVELSDEGYSPAVIVVQAGLDAEWTVDNTSSAEDNFTMLVPYYNTRLDLKPGKNPLYLFPTEYFSFSNGDNSFYGYVKVVDDLNIIDEAAIKAEAAAYETLIYPPETFLAGASRSCH